jgi:hypothetical protein
MQSPEKHAVNSSTAFDYCGNYNEIMRLDTFFASCTLLQMAEVQTVAFKNFDCYSK